MPRPPTADPATFDVAAAARGQVLFQGAAGCAACHSGSSFTDAPTLHTPAEVGQSAAYANRTVNKLYRTTPLRGVASHPPYFHDGSAATLRDVVVHYDGQVGLGLTDAQMNDLVAYLNSLDAVQSPGVRWHSRPIPPHRSP